MKRNDEEGFLTLLRDIVKQITNTWKIMTLRNCQNALNILTKIIFMAGQWVIIFLMVGLSG